MKSTTFTILKKEIEKKLANDVKHQFLESIKNETVLKEYDERDIERLKKNNVYFHLYVRARQGDVDRAFNMMHESLKWRKTFKINDLSEVKLDENVLKLGLLYYHNFDKKNNAILIFHGNKFEMKDHAKVLAVQKIFAHLVEKQQNHHPGNKMTVICDHTDAKLSNMDFDFFKFVVNLFSIYYPEILENFLVLNSTWRVSAAWKTIRNWLSDWMSTKFLLVDNTQLTEYVDADNILCSMGGKDDFVYAGPPIPDNTHDTIEESTSSTEFHSSQEEVTDALLEADDKILDDEGHSSQRSKVTMGGSLGTQLRQRMKDGSSKSESSTFVEEQVYQPALIVSPKDEIVFREVENESEIQEKITLINNSPESIIFKIKTNSPTNFRARPNLGAILPGSRKEITLMLIVRSEPVPEKHSVKDKFLILHSETSDIITNSTDIAELWKTVPKMDIEEHKLCCRVLDVNGFEKRPKTIEDVLEISLKLEKQISQLDTKLDKENVLLEKITKTQKHQKIMMILVLTVLLLLCFVVWVW